MLKIQSWTLIWVPGSNSPYTTKQCWEPAGCPTVLTQFWQPLSADSTRFHRLKAHSHKIALWFRCQVITCTSDWLAIKSEVPMTLSLGSMKLLEQLIELKKPIYSLAYQFITKDIKDMNQQLDEEIHRARYMGRDTDLPCSLQACCPPSISTSSPGSWNPVLWDFMKASLPRHDWLNHWP